MPDMYRYVWFMAGYVSDLWLGMVCSDWSPVNCLEMEVAKMWVCVCEKFYLSWSEMLRNKTAAFCRLAGGWFWVIFSQKLFLILPPGGPSQHSLLARCSSLMCTPQWLRGDVRLTNLEEANWTFHLLSQKVEWSWIYPTKKVQKCGLEWEMPTNPARARKLLHIATSEDLNMPLKDCRDSSGPQWQLLEAQAL